LATADPGSDHVGPRRFHESSMKTKVDSTIDGLIDETRDFVNGEMAKLRDEIAEVRSGHE
jgi:hypothetical protein